MGERNESWSALARADAAWKLQTAWWVACMRANLLSLFFAQNMLYDSSVRVSFRYHVSSPETAANDSIDRHACGCVIGKVTWSFVPYYDSVLEVVLSISFLFFLACFSPALHWYLREVSAILRLFAQNIRITSVFNRVNDWFCLFISDQKW